MARRYASFIEIMKNAIYMLAPAGTRQMNSFIITTVGGRIIIVDGGFYDDAETLISKLREITGQERPTIDAWILSHSHEDHIDAFMRIMNESPCALDLNGKIYYNFPSVQFFAHEDKSAVNTATQFYKLLPKFADKACIVSGGDVYEIGDARFEILYSPMSEFKRASCNNSSVVFKLLLGGKSALFLGDCGVEAGNKLLEFYAGTGVLKSDICQMAHHGQGGVTKEFYREVSPKVCFWNTPLWLWNNDIGKGFDTYIFETVKVRGWMDEIGAETHFVMKDGLGVYEW